ncbi:MAG: adenylate/guanylate cyclase domain-containing protein [Nitratireductor sp.]|nr:adenylate/guanylate cyclase domain-containing protein [Nitratireductor sp.]
MSIAAINEQLLRAIGVGVALLDIDDLKFQFFNDTFVEWFGEPDSDARLTDLFTAMDAEVLRRGLAEGGRFATETTFKLRRRTMTVAMEFNRAPDAGGKIAVVVCQNITRIKELESMIDSYSMMVERNTREIKREKEQVEKLLLNMMPRSVYEEYKTFGVVTPRLYDPVSVLTLDFCGFSDLVATVDPGVIVSELNDLYSAFDRIGEQFGCERIKTIGDAYITVAGMPDPSPDHVQSVANAAIRFLRYIAHRNESHPIKWQCRIGLSAGSVIGSVVGVQKYIYDVFGPAVTRALRIRAHAEPMTICGDAEIAGSLNGKFRKTGLGGQDIGGERIEIVRIEAETEPARAVGIQS